MARITSVIAGLACALLMCLAVPVAAAPVDNLIFDSGGSFDLVAAPAMGDLVAVVDVFDDAFDRTSPMLDLADVDSSVTAERLPPCRTSRYYDPGWRAS